ncbi:hypothetical protein P7K49_032825 [Saguinus oedipus]|uniref:BTB domain-containing protein n=1 Tax=Saguinus oedipus TaxID=9490 RepID=A0ABQ9TR99_SAGOE|nr:hypothetical protein P7K49_032825 [Saguinus oedipus]
MVRSPDLSPGAGHGGPIPWLPRCHCRFLYSDEVQIGPETVMTTLYTAKKYAVPALEAHCVEFLKKNLRADNAFMLLTQCQEDSTVGVSGDPRWALQSGELVGSGEVVPSRGAERSVWGQDRWAARGSPEFPVGGWGHPEGTVVSVLRWVFGVQHPGKDPEPSPSIPAGQTQGIPDPQREGFLLGSSVVTLP